MRRCALLLAAALALAACPLPIPVVIIRTDITVVLSSPGGAGAKTVMPDFSNQIDEIEVDLHSNDGYADPAAAFCHAAPWQVTVTDVPVGSWNLHVVARKGGVQVATADDNGLTLTTGVPLSVPITLSFTAAAATGSVQFMVRFPDSVGIDYVQGLLEETSDTSVPALSSAGGNTSGTFQFSSLPTGTYSLVMTFRRGGAAGTSAGIFREKVVVLGGFQSSGWVNSSGGLDPRRTFAANEFLEGAASLSGLVVSGTFTSGFSSSIYSYVGNPIPDASVTFTATGSISGEYIQYGWDGAALAEIGSGVVSPAHVTGATNTLQVRVTAPDKQTTRDYTVTFARGYALTYQPNGATYGSAPVDSAWHAAGESVTVLPNSGGLYLSGKVFVGWNTNAAGTGFTYYPGSVFSMPASAADLYACWGPVPGMQSLVAQVTGPTTVQVTWTTPSDPSIVQSIINWGSGNSPATSIGPYQYTYQLSATTNTLYTFTVTAQDAGGNPMAVGTVSAYCADSASYPTGTGYSIPYGSGTLNFEVDASGNITIDGSTAGVTDLIIPSSIGGHPVMAVKQEAFSGNHYITSIVVPSTVTSMGTWPFWQNSAMISASLPDSLTYVPDHAFDCCYIVQSVRVPAYAIFIGDSAFNDCFDLASIDIPSTITTIAAVAFNGCTSLQTMNVHAATPPTLDPSALGATPGSMIIYVPTASVAAYKTAAVWVNYAGQIQAGTW
jgi:hypothetical protein